MIGATVPVPVKREGGEPVVPVSTVGETDLNEDLTMAILELNATMKDILCEIRLLNERVECAFETTVRHEDVTAC